MKYALGGVVVVMAGNRFYTVKEVVEMMDSDDDDGPGNEPLCDGSDEDFLTDTDASDNER